MKSLKLIWLLIFSSIFQIQIGRCTDCAEKTIEQIIKEADLIFIGNSISGSKSSSIKFIYEFEIEKILKNTTEIKAKKIKITSYDIIWFCGAYVPLNTRQLVMAIWNEEDEYFTIWGEQNLIISDIRNKDKLEKAEEILNYSFEKEWNWTLILICMFSGILITAISIIKN